MEVREHLAALEVRGASAYVLHAEKGRRTAGGDHTRYSTASKRNADYEHAGVAIAVHKKWIHLVEEVREISGRTITVLLLSLIHI